MGSRPDGWWRDRAAAAARLVTRLQALPGAVVLHEGRRRTVGSVVVVLEGAARAGVPAGGRGGLDVRHAPASGDDLLAGLAVPGALLVTADRGLARRARLRGAGVVGPRWLLEHVLAATAPGVGQDEAVESTTSPDGSAAPPR